jgi:hypothetical protein
MGFPFLLTGGFGSALQISALIIGLAFIPLLLYNILLERV